MLMIKDKLRKMHTKQDGLKSNSLYKTNNTLQVKFVKKQQSRANKKQTKALRLHTIYGVFIITPVRKINQFDMVGKPA